MEAVGPVSVGVSLRARGGATQGGSKEPGGYKFLIGRDHYPLTRQVSPRDLAMAQWGSRRSSYTINRKIQNLRLIIELARRFATGDFPIWRLCKSALMAYAGDGSNISARSSTNRRIPRGARRRYTRLPADEIRAGYQSEDRESARHHLPSVDPARADEVSSRSRLRRCWHISDSARCLT
jgi:hypothetical protein